MSHRILLLSLGSAALTVGFIFLFVPVAYYGGESCGGAFAAKISEILATQEYTDYCGEARVGRWEYLAPMLLGGIALALVGLNTPAVGGPAPVVDDGVKAAE
jgi:hypothetical protein